MPDNVGYTPGTGATVAADDIGGVLHQRVKIGIGADGSATDVSSANPMPVTAPSGLNVTVGNFPATQAVTVGNFPATQPVSGPLTDAQLRASSVSVFSNDPSAGTNFGPITTANTPLFTAIDTANERTVVLQLTGNFVGGIALQASQDGTNWWSCQGFGSSSDVVVTDTFYNTDVITIPVIARFFRAITTSDFVGTVSGSYVQRTIDVPPFWNNSQLVAVDPAVTMPMGGVDPNGNVRRIALEENGGLRPADGRTVTGTRAGAQVGTIVLVDTTGYGSVVLQLQGTFTGTMTFQVSNDLTTWSSTAGWAVAGAAAPTSTATAVGQWVIPAAGRFFRAQVTTAGTGNPVAIATLKNFSAWFPASSPSIAANSSVNLAQINATTPVTGGVAGILAIGGNIAVGAAPTANPIPLAWDGTNTRRILTDASSGGVVLGSSTVTNGQTLARFSQTVTTPAATQIKASAGRLTMLSISNGGTVAGFLHIYNAAAVTLGTTTDVHCYAVPASVVNYDIALPDGGLFFSAGIGVAFTAGSGATDNTAFGSAPTLIGNYAFI